MWISTETRETEYLQPHDIHTCCEIEIFNLFLFYCHCVPAFLLPGIISESKEK